MNTLRKKSPKSFTIQFNIAGLPSTISLLKYKLVQATKMFKPIIKTKKVNNKR